MKLYLMQHADAVSKQEHPARPLSAKGMDDAIKIAGFLERSGMMVDKMFHSGKLRTRDTANALANAIMPGHFTEPLGGLNPNDSTDNLTDVTKNAKGDIMAVSHMPFVARMAARCLTGDEDGVSVAFQPGSVLCLEREEEVWSVVWMVAPDQLA